LSRRALYAMCDPEWMAEHLRDDLALQLAVYAGDPASGVPLFDMNVVHQREYEQASGSYHEYMSRYMVGGDGHYSPRGNHFFACALKDRLLELLDPKPLPYAHRRDQRLCVSVLLAQLGGFRGLGCGTVMPELDRAG
jgi:hypothetical protein